MTHIIFRDSSGEVSAEVDAPAGERLLDIAQHADQPLEGTCEGQMACSTCHVILARIEGEPPEPPSEEEEDLLDFASGAVRESRLACQIYTSVGLRMLEVRMPDGVVDMSR